MLSGNIAFAIGPAAVAQDVASAVRLFRGELWYDTSQGVPYFETILGQRPPMGVMSARFIAAGMTVPEVSKISCSLNPIGMDRLLTGTLSITTVLGQTTVLETPWYVSAVKP